MLRFGRWPFLLLFVVLAACLTSCADKASPTPTAPTATMASSAPNERAAASGVPRCVAVQFEANGVFPFWAPLPLTWTLSGDLEGTMDVTPDLANRKYSGPPPFASGGNMYWEGTAEWHITGGVVSGLTFETVVANRNLISDRPGSPFTVYENIGTQKATSGVAKANFSYKGTGVNDFVAMTQTGSHRYMGEICK